jgi:hypothetical protein
MSHVNCIHNMYSRHEHIFIYINIYDQHKEEFQEYAYQRYEEMCESCW